MKKNLPIIVKIAPDLTDQEMKDIAEVSLRKNVKLSPLKNIFLFSVYERLENYLRKRLTV
jgi:dihydroorotate dehydrogenase